MLKDIKSMNQNIFLTVDTTCPLARCETPPTPKTPGFELPATIGKKQALKIIGLVHSKYWLFFEDVSHVFVRQINILRPAIPSNRSCITSINYLFSPFHIVEDEVRIENESKSIEKHHRDRDHHHRDKSRHRHG